MSKGVQELGTQTTSQFLEFLCIDDGRFQLNFLVGRPCGLVWLGLIQVGHSGSRNSFFRMLGTNLKKSRKKQNTTTKKRLKGVDSS